MRKEVNIDIRRNISHSLWQIRITFRMMYGGDVSPLLTLRTIIKDFDIWVEDGPIILSIGEIDRRRASQAFWIKQAKRRETGLDNCEVFEALPAHFRKKRI